jgi:hypothetical protein
MKPTQKMINAAAEKIVNHLISTSSHFARYTATIALTAALAEYEDENERLRVALQKANDEYKAIDILFERYMNDPL